MYLSRDNSQTKKAIGLFRTQRDGRKLVYTLLLHFLLILGSVFMLAPFVWMILSSLKQSWQVFLIPPMWLPETWEWGNYLKSWQALPFATAYFNSFYIAVVSVAGQLVTCSMAAYAFARIRFALSKPLFSLFLATMMVPNQVTIIPWYLMMKQLGWIDTHTSLIVPSILLNAFGVFLLRQFILGIPIELDEAAFMDGANRLRIYGQIILPLIRPALSALAIFSFLNMWNSFFTPMIMLDTPKKFTVPLMLNMFRGMYITDWTLLMAGSAIAAVPVLIVYIIGQKYIIEGVTLSGLKG